MAKKNRNISNDMRNKILSKAREKEEEAKAKMMGDSIEEPANQNSDIKNLETNIEEEKEMDRIDVLDPNEEAVGGLNLGGLLNTTPEEKEAINAGAVNEGELKIEDDGLKTDDEKKDKKDDKKSGVNANELLEHASKKVSADITKVAQSAELARLDQAISSHLQVDTFYTKNAVRTVMDLKKTKKVKKDSNNEVIYVNREANEKSYDVSYSVVMKTLRPGRPVMVAISGPKSLYELLMETTSIDSIVPEVLKEKLDAIVDAEGKLIQSAENEKVNVSMSYDEFCTKMFAVVSDIGIKENPDIWTAPVIKDGTTYSPSAKSEHAQGNVSYIHNRTKADDEALAYIIEASEGAQIDTAKLKSAQDRIEKYKKGQGVNIKRNCGGVSPLITPTNFVPIAIDKTVTPFAQDFEMTEDVSAALNAYMTSRGSFEDNFNNADKAIQSAFFVKTVVDGNTKFDQKLKCFEVGVDAKDRAESLHKAGIKYEDWFTKASVPMVKTEDVNGTEEVVGASDELAKLPFVLGEINADGKFEFQVTTFNNEGYKIDSPVLDVYKKAIGDDTKAAEFLSDAKDYKKIKENQTKQRESKATRMRKRTILAGAFSAADKVKDKLVQESLEAR